MNRMVNMRIEFTEAENSVLESLKGSMGLKSKQEVLKELLKKAVDDTSNVTSMTHGMTHDDTRVISHVTHDDTSNLNSGFTEADKVDSSCVMDDSLLNTCDTNDTSNVLLHDTNDKKLNDTPCDMMTHELLMSIDRKLDALKGQSGLIRSQLNNIDVDPQIISACVLHSFTKALTLRLNPVKDKAGAEVVFINSSIRSSYVDRFKELAERHNWS